VRAGEAAVGAMVSERVAVAARRAAAAVAAAGAPEGGRSAARSWSAEGQAWGWSSSPRQRAIR
jgi:hypothetical protein